MDVLSQSSSEWSRIESQLPPNWREMAKNLGLCRSMPSKLGERAKLSDPLARTGRFHILQVPQGLLEESRRSKNGKKKNDVSAEHAGVPNIEAALHAGTFPFDQMSNLIPCANGSLVP